MISLMCEFNSGILLDVSFPNSKVFIQDISGIGKDEGVILLDNKPGLSHWVLVMVSNIDTCDFARLTEIEYLSTCYLRVCTYTIIPARDQKALSKKVKYVGAYYRSHSRDNLFNLRWTSSKIFANSFGEIVSINSPIQLFGRYRNYYILYIWASGFLSILDSGRLEVRLSFYCFCLGTRYNNLSSA